MTSAPSGYGRAWFEALADGGPDRTATLPASVLVGATEVDGQPASLLAVVPDPSSRFPRARNGEMGLAEGWAVARAVRAVMAADGDGRRRPLIVVVDVPSQAYGYVEELAGIHQSLAAAVDALASARTAGHPVTALIVGNAISGAFLAIGLQADRIVALRHEGVAVQVMSRHSTARITRRSLELLDEIASFAPATAHDIDSFARLGALHAVVDVDSPAAPTAADVDRVRAALASATASAGTAGSGLLGRLDSPGAREQRAASRLVRARVAAAWDAP